MTAPVLAAALVDWSGGAPIGIGWGLLLLVGLVGCAVHGWRRRVCRPVPLDGEG